MVGLVHLYTGNGKGKTTSAFGLALRTVGRGGRALIIQFMKNTPSGEVLAAERVEGLEVRLFGAPGFVKPGEPRPEDVEKAREGIEAAREALRSGDYRLVVLDEVNVAVAFGLLSEEEVVETVRSRHPETEVVLTGRYAPQSFYDLADYVTEFREVKHPYTRGISARPGIEF